MYVVTGTIDHDNSSKCCIRQISIFNTGKQHKIKLLWFSCLLWHSARKRGGLILQRSRAHTGHFNTGNISPVQVTVNPPGWVVAWAVWPVAVLCVLRWPEPVHPHHCPPPDPHHWQHGRPLGAETNVISAASARRTTLAYKYIPHVFSQSFNILPSS